jgi:[acyl-carrier-protein] S-malonyltransferase
VINAFLNFNFAVCMPGQAHVNDHDEQPFPRIHPTLHLLPMLPPILLFPGQGSHEVGMGADLFRADEWFRGLVRQASDTLGEDLERLCLRGPEKRLMRAAFVQPLLVAVSLGYWRHLTGAGLAPAAVAGHSLGEITALAAAGALTPEQAVAVAIERGRCMDEAAARTPGGMAAVFLPLAEVERLLVEFGLAGRVFVANDNAPGQVVVSAARDNLDEFVRRLAESRAGKAKPLRVSGPWHTPLLHDAQTCFAAWLAGISFSPPRLPLLLNTTATAEAEPGRLREAAIRQLTDRVRWRETMSALKAMSPSALVEVGPQRVLAGLARLNGFGAETAVANINSLRAAEEWGRHHVQPDHETRTRTPPS